MKPFKGARKYQNLRIDPAESVRTIQQGGLWVLGGFILGFDADDESIFDGQISFISEAEIVWAMVGCLQAPPTTPLYDRMKLIVRRTRILVRPSSTLKCRVRHW